MSSSHSTPRAPRRRRQYGITLLEVLVAMLLFLVAASALVLMINQAYVANAQSLRTFAATSTARSLLAMVEGNSSMLGSLNGTQLSAKNPTVSSTSLNPLLNWWTAQVTQYPDLQSLSISTTPSGSSGPGICSATAPCQIIADVTVRSAFGGSVKRTFVLQDGF